MDGTTKELLEKNNQRMSVVIALLLKLIPENGAALSMRDQIELLDNLGLRPVEIADVIGRTSGYVSKELASIRKAK